VAASAWQTSDGYRDGSARRGEEARAIPANDNAVAERKQASEEVGRAHSSLVRNRRLVTVRVARVWAVTSDRCCWFSGWRRGDSRRLCRSV
jgi:hypothetical protein